VEDFGRAGAETDGAVGVGVWTDSGLVGAASVAKAVLLSTEQSHAMPISTTVITFQTHIMITHTTP